MAEITLRKYHGLGNDYLIYDPNRNACELQERQVEALCRRNLGVGADGILYGPFFDGDKMRVRIFNPDGSEAEKSGNGIRIFSKYLKDMGYVTEESYVLHTKAGETRVTFLNEQGDLMRVDMGYPEFVAKEIPVVGFEGEIVNEAIFFGDNFYNATCVSLGNPNCVLMLEEVSQKKAMQLGPYVENSRYFPNRINMQLCQVLDRENIQIEIYERGAGYTYASGTGACAAAAASHKMGFVGDRVTVHMHGGELLVEFARDVLGWKDADSAEFSETTSHPVIALMPDQVGVTAKGGTMRLGSCPCRVTGEDTFTYKAYGSLDIAERHRHRYEFNNQFREALVETGGLTLAGLSPDGRLVEIVERRDHPWFVGVQFHPELKSRPNKAHPLFREFIAAAKARRQK